MKIKVEIDEGQNTTQMVFEGDRCRERVIQFLEALQVSSEQPQSQGQTQTRANNKNLTELPELDEDLTLKERLKLFLKYEYSDRWFGSKEAKRAYDTTYGKDLALSTVSTYLSRMYRGGFLERRGSRAEREYRVAEPPETDGSGVEEPSTGSGRI